jgi:DNA-binding NtrC family response regulator
MAPFFTMETSASLRAFAPVVESLVMQRTFELAARTADSPFNILIVGEAGVGKRTLARWIHVKSRRRRGLFVTVRCGQRASDVDKAMFGSGPLTKGGGPGAFEAAGKGTVVLKDVGSLGLAPQTRLLHMIEHRAVWRIGEAQGRPVEARIISTSPVDLGPATDALSFRLDLLFPLSALTLRLPPLRERREDIVALAVRFLTEATEGRQRLTLSAAVRDLFGSFPWPGNLAQLRDVIVEALARCKGSEITPKHIDVAALRRERISEPAINAAQGERARIMAALARGNATDLAQMLGMSRRALIQKLEQYRIPRRRPGHATK